MLTRFLELLGDAKRVAVVTHRRADFDALACGKIVQAVLEKLGVESILACPEGSPVGNCKSDVPNDVDMYVLVDVASLSQVPPLSKPHFRVDHHHVGDGVVGIWKNRPSCVEVALELADEAGVELSTDLAKLAILGIYYDTGRLKRADWETLSRLSKLLQRVGGTVGDVVEAAERRVDPVAMLKGLRRLEVYKSQFGLLCTSHVGAYESEVASVLVSVGCDVAIVASRKRGEVRLAMRSRNFDVGSLARRLGSGGGHREAAVATLAVEVAKSDLPTLLREVVQVIDAGAVALV